MKRIVLMPDYSADPLWNNDVGDMVSLDALPISAALRDRIRSWANRWEDFANRAIMDETLADDEAAYAPIQEEMEALWEALRKELHGRYEVGMAVPPPGRKQRAHVVWAPGGTPELAGWFR